MGSAAIPLQVQPVQVASPIQSIGRLMQLKSGMADIALKQQQEKQAEQQTELINAEQQQRNRDLADQNTIQELMKNPSIAPKIAAGDFSPLNGRVQPKNALQFRQAVGEIHQKEATANETDLKNKGEAIGKLTDAFKGLQTSFGDDVGKWNENLPGVINRLDAQGYFKLAGIDPANLPKAVGSTDDIKRMEASLGVLAGVNEGAQAYKKTQTEVAAKEAETAQKQAETANLQTQQPGLEAEARKKQLVTQAMEQALANPEQGDALIDGALPASVDPQANAAYKTARKAALAAGDVEGAARIVATAASHATALSKATIQNKVDTAVAEKKATIPLEIAADVQKQVQLAKLSPDAFAGIFDPTERRQAENKYEASSKDYADKVSAARQLQDFITAAQSGNKAAPGLIGISELRQLVNRVNAQELRAVSSGAGDAKDRIEGWLKGYTEGQPIPPAVLSDMSTLSKVTEQAAKRSYDYQLAVIKSAHPGAKVQPVELPEYKPSVVTPAVAPIQLKDGRTLTPHTQADADRFRKDHPELIK